MLLHAFTHNRILGRIERDAMRYQPVSALPMIEEEDATGEVAQMYAEIRREMGLPYIPNAAKTLAVSPVALGCFWLSHPQLQPAPPCRSL